MTGPALSRNDRRALVIGAAILLPALVFGYAVRPMQRALDARRATIGTERELLARELALVADAPRVPDMIVARQHALDEDSARVVVSDAPATASVRFADRVRDMARAHDLLVSQTTELAADSLRGGVRVLRLAVRGESDLAGILGFLRAIETGSMSVRVASLQIEQPRSARASATPLHQPTAEVLSLTAVLEVPSLLSAPQPRGGR